VVETTVTEAPSTTDNILVVTDAEVADLEKQLDEIDQLLAGVDADLAQD
jgi:tetrahydromethanopterin S-methyltransferase subunit G